MLTKGKKKLHISASWHDELLCFCAHQSSLAPLQFLAPTHVACLLQDIQRQLEELQQSVEDSSEMAAEVQQLRQQNLELDRC